MTSVFSVTRLVDCGMSSPTIHIPAVWAYASIFSVNGRPHSPGSMNEARNAGPSARVSM